MNDRESERRVLSGIILADNDTTIITALEALSPDDFTDPLHKRVYQVCTRLYTKGVKPTYVEVLRDVKPSNVQENDELAYIANQYIDGRNIGHWCGMVKDASKRRALDRLNRQLTGALSDKMPVDEIVSLLSDQLTALALTEQGQYMSGADIAREAIDLIEAKVAAYRKMVQDGQAYQVLEGAPTGFGTLNKYTFGYKPGDLVIIAAKTGDGKTALALQTATAIAVDMGIPALYVNTEMGKTQIDFRLGSTLTGEKGFAIREGSLSSSQVSRLVDGYGRLAQSPFHLITDPSLTVQRLQTHARKYKIQEDIAVMIVDYVGRMDKLSDDMKEWQRLEQIVRVQKDIAQQLDIAVICLVQLNDDESLQGAKRMKNEADIMLKLLPLQVDSQGRPTEKGFEAYPSANYKLTIDKNRDGATGQIPLVFDKSCQQLREANKEGWHSIGKAVN